MITCSSFVLCIIALVIANVQDQDKGDIEKLEDLNGAKIGPNPFDNNDGDHVLGISSDYIYIIEIMVSLLIFITTLSTVCRCVQRIEHKRKNIVDYNEDPGENIQV